MSPRFEHQTPMNWAAFVLLPPFAAPNSYNLHRYRVQAFVGLAVAVVSLGGELLQTLPAPYPLDELGLELRFHPAARTCPTATALQRPASSSG